MASREIVHIIDVDSDLLQELGFVLATAGLATCLHKSAAAFLEALPEAQAGCIVSAVSMPEMGVLELQRRLRAADCTMPLVVMAGPGDAGRAAEAMKAGAADFIEKPVDGDVLLATVVAALQRQRDGREDAGEVRRRLKVLSESERQVLEGVVAGKPTKVIARDLGLSAPTVEASRAEAMVKIKADSLAALICMIFADSSALPPGGGDAPAASSD